MHPVQFLLAMALLAFAPAAHANPDDAQVWLSLSATKKLTDSFDLVADMNSRYFDNASHYGHFQVRGMIGWKPDGGRSRTQLGLGYSYVWATNLGGTVVRDHRIFQQASYPLLDIGKSELVGRTRLEERWYSDSSGTFVRLRQQVRLNIPLEGPDGLTAVVHTEALIMLHTPPPDDDGEGINQFRTFGGLIIPLDEVLSLEAGYMNQTTVKGPNRTNHVLSLGVNAKF